MTFGFIAAMERISDDLLCCFSHENISHLLKCLSVYHKDLYSQCTYISEIPFLAMDKNRGARYVDNIKKFYCQLPIRTGGCTLEVALERRVSFTKDAYCLGICGML